MPPAPVMVTSRCCASSARTASRSLARPISRGSDVGCATQRRGCRLYGLRRVIEPRRESVAAPGDRRNGLRPEQLAQRPHLHLQVVVGDDESRPHDLEQLIAADRAIAPLDQREQKVEGSLAERCLLAVDPQRAPRRIDAKAAERVLAGKWSRLARRLPEATGARLVHRRTITPRKGCRDGDAILRPMNAHATANPQDLVESPYAWTRLAVSLVLMTIGGSGMYSITVVLPAIQAEFGVDSRRCVAAVHADDDRLRARRRADGAAGRPLRRDGAGDGGLRRASAPASSPRAPPAACWCSASRRGC